MCLHMSITEIDFYISNLELQVNTISFTLLKVFEERERDD